MGRFPRSVSARRLKPDRRGRDCLITPAANFQSDRPLLPRPLFLFCSGGCLTPAWSQMQTSLLTESSDNRSPGRHVSPPQTGGEAIAGLHSCGQNSRPTTSCSTKSQWIRRGTRGAWPDGFPISRSIWAWRKSSKSEGPVLSPKGNGPQHTLRRFILSHCSVPGRSMVAR
jgi:hypothetical protein